MTHNDPWCIKKFWIWKMLLFHHVDLREKPNNNTGPDVEWNYKFNKWCCKYWNKTRGGGVGGRRGGWNELNDLLLKEAVIPFRYLTSHGTHNENISWTDRQSFHRLHRQFWRSSGPDRTARRYPAQPQRMMDGLNADYKRSYIFICPSERAIEYITLFLLTFCLIIIDPSWPMLRCFGSSGPGPGPVSGFVEMFFGSNEAIISAHYTRRVRDRDNDTCFNDLVSRCDRLD